MDQGVTGCGAKKNVLHLAFSHGENPILVSQRVLCASLPPIVGGYDLKVRALAKIHAQRVPVPTFPRILGDRMCARD